MNAVDVPSKATLKPLCQIGPKSRLTLFCQIGIQSGRQYHARLHFPIGTNRAIGIQIEPIGPDCFGSGSYMLLDVFWMLGFLKNES